MPQVQKEDKAEWLCEDEFKEPVLYKVILHNDDYTTMDFVVLILQNIFRKSLEEAQQIMLKVHNDGLATVGVYTKEIAETKVDKVKKSAKQAGYPLLCSYEPVS